MGKVPLPESRPAQSSGKLSALLRRNHHRIGLIAAALSAAVLAACLIMVLWQASAVKQVTLIVDGQARQIRTEAGTVGELLEEQDIRVQEHDIVSESPKTALRDGDTISVDHAVPVTVQADGETIKHYTTADTVGDTLKELAISLGDQDKTVPAPDEEIDAHDTIKVVRVETVIEEVQETIPFETVTTKDPNLLKGKSAVVQEGEEGVVVKTYRKVLEDGVVVSETLIDEEVAKPSQNKVVAVGTKNPVTVLSSSSPVVQQVTKDGITFGARQVLNNVKLTAYHAGPESTGKTEGDSWYGVTYTGTRATEGRTIAVDPEVIPLGWWVYIEGIGFRRAEDIGSAVKGKKIDIYFESAEHAKKFGVKSGYTVYVIGPQKPEGLE